MSQRDLQLLNVITQSPFDIIIFHYVVDEIHIVGHTYWCYNPENGVSVNAREWFGIFFLLTWKTMEKKKKKKKSKISVLLHASS